jgi:hypothetical protein
VEDSAGVGQPTLGNQGEVPGWDPFSFSPSLPTWGKWPSFALLLSTIGLACTTNLKRERIYSIAKDLTKNMKDKERQHIVFKESSKGVQ